jgi:hypothetical protein
MLLIYDIKKAKLPPYHNDTKKVDHMEKIIFGRFLVMLVSLS